MDKQNVLILMPFAKRWIEGLQTAFSQECEFTVVDRNADKESLQNAIEEADIIFGEPDLDLLQGVEKLKWVQMSFAGTDKYTLHPEFPKGVLLSNARGAFGVQMAEYAVGAILMHARMLSVYQRQMAEGLWQDAQPKGAAADRIYADNGFGAEDTLEGKTVLILGCGNIGSETAKRFRAFGCHIIGVKKHTPEAPIEGFDELYTLDQIDLLLPRTDIFIGCVPNGEGTIGLMNRERLLSMPKDSMLLNMGRGQLIDTEALVSVLEAGWFRFVCLDVVDPEPLPEEHPLWRQERVLITPHISGSSFGHNQKTEQRIYELCCENLRHFLCGEPLRNQIQLQ